MEIELYDEGALEREATIDVSRGLYILRYLSGVALGASPVAMARPAPGSEPFVEVISAPGILTGFLSYPGECLVVRAERVGKLLVRVMRQSAAESFDASFRLEPVFGAERSAAPVLAGAPETASASPQSGGGQKFTLLAHVSRRGDVEVRAGEWVAGPNAPSAIEGLEIRGALGSGLRIEIQPLVSTTPLRWLDWAAPGGFAGSRGRALPLAGLRLRLAGDDASRFVLSADALFLGSAILSKRGREIELVGAASGDPLVGLRLDLAPEAFAVAGNIDHAGAAIAPQRVEPRVRVFRAAANN